MPSIAPVASFAHLAVQFRFETVGILKIHRHFVAVEGQRPGLDFSAPQDPPLHRKGTFVDPASLGGVYSVKRGGTLAVAAIKPDQSCKPVGGPLRLAGVGRDYP